jgi:peptidoglycan/LPS O-acetylase OafA/YrhL
VSPTGGAAQDIGAAGFEAGPILHFPCFDAFRFFGMTMVLLVHSAFATRPWVQEHLPEWMQALLERMDVGVAIFFVLSGFLLFRPFIARQLAGKAPMKTGTFLWRRSLRVLPGYWFALTFCVVFLGQLLGSAKNAFLYYSLLFPYAGESVALGGGPGEEGNYAIPQAWSITAEFVFYLMLPVVAILLVRLAARKAPAVQVRTALLICLALYLFGQLFRLYFLVAEPSWARVAVIWAPNWIDFFAIGMLTATYSAAHHAGMRLPSLLRLLGDHPAWSWCVAALVGLSFATFSPPDTPGVFGAEYWVRWFLFGVFAFFLLAPAMFGDQTQGVGRRILASRPLVLLGTVSLGFYLFHLAVMTNVQDWLAPEGTSSIFYGSLPAVFSLTFVVAIALAFLSYYLVERPFLRLKDHSLTSRGRRPPAKASS